MLALLVFTLLQAAFCIDPLNPDRGIMTNEVVDTTFTPFDAYYYSVRKSENKTVSQRVYYLKGYTGTDLPTSFLDNLALDFQRARTAGFRLMIRFAYSDNPNASPLDAPLSVVQSHLNQISPILTTHAAAIAAFQAGFSGAYGEWYYTTYYSTDSAKIALLQAIDAAVPQEIPIHVRTPAIYNLNSGVDKSRYGLYDDCILADATDTGTFTTLSEVDVFKMPSSGETCAPSFYTNQTCDDEIWFHLYSLKLGYLNDVWNNYVVSAWKNNTCWAMIKQNIGYVPNLLNHSLTQINFTNDGWARPSRNWTAAAIIIPDSQYYDSTANTRTAFKVDLGVWDMSTFIADSIYTKPLLTIPTSGPTLTEDHEVFLLISSGGYPDVAYRVVLSETWANTRLNDLYETLPYQSRMPTSAVPITIDLTTGVIS
jgi:hypothetical protein